MFVGCFILGAVAFFSMFLMNMSPIPLKQTFCLRQTLKQTMKRQTVKMISCHVVHLKRQTVTMITCHVVMLQSFVKKTMTHLDAWSGNTMKGGQIQVNLIGNAVWLDVCGPLFRMVRGFPQWRTWHRMKLMTVMSWVIGLRKVRFLKLVPHHLPIQKIWRVGVPWTWFARTPRHTRWSRGIRSGVQCPWIGWWTSQAGTWVQGPLALWQGMWWLRAVKRTHTC